LLGWFGHECQHVVSADASILRSGLIDSLATLRLLAFVETEFGMHLNVADLLAAKIDTVRGLAELIGKERKR
ncbi:MAG TPA: acyl carrier protein, partial [Chthoniobacteraceae bacterium]|nr:acyl carrier protein [Chthoniobacteraceae bacterium]